MISPILGWLAAKHSFFELSSLDDHFALCLALLVAKHSSSELSASQAVHCMKPPEARETYFSLSKLSYSL